MRFIIIGLGIYGENLARNLTDMGHQVIGADRSQSHVDALKDYISTVYLIDSTEQAQLEVLPLRNVDLVIVAIGENFGASIKTVALLKQAGVKHIYARAIDKLHEAILESFEIDRIITPEQRAAADLTRELELGSAVQTLPVDNEYAVVNFVTPEYFHGLSYRELRKKLAEDFGLTLVAACRMTERTNVLGISRAELSLIDMGAEAAVQVVGGDRFTLFGSRRQLRDLFRRVNG
ncbi:MAG: TrkA family potassium uptake protein [Muribaculaceae bacterium]|nr:TrkA family potassium uptake protein [Muribaculaceae bacterium]MDE6611835.1 TrkA family potassium uptake protein [Muribaculaceae bacterium]